MIEKDVKKIMNAQTKLSKKNSIQDIKKKKDSVLTIIKKKKKVVKCIPDNRSGDPASGAIASGPVFGP